MQHGRDIHPSFAHLDTDQLTQLVSEYYARSGSVTEIMKRFAIAGKPSNFVAMLPSVVHPDQKCPYCDDVSLISVRQSRDSKAKGLPRCPECDHQDQVSCTCNTCKFYRAAKQTAIDSTKRALIVANYPPLTNVSRNAANASLRNALYIMALFRHSATEDLSWARPFNDKKEPLAPTHDFRSAAVLSLHRSGYIRISAQSPLDAFVYNDDITECPRYYPGKVFWEFLPGQSLAEKRIFLRELSSLAKVGPWPDTWDAESRSVWLEISKAECIEYYALMLEQRSYDAEIGPKTNAVFDDLLERFSVGQIFYLIWSSVKDTTDYIVKERLPKYAAKNYYIGSLQRKAERAVAQEWDVRNARRDYARPQSFVSAVWFDAFIEIGDDCLNRLPPKPASNDQVQAVDVVAS